MPFTVEAKEPYIPALHDQQRSVPDVSVVEAKKKKKTLRTVSCNLFFALGMYYFNIL